MNEKIKQLITEYEQKLTEAKQYREQLKEELKTQKGLAYRFTAERKNIVTNYIITINNFLQKLYDIKED